VCWSWIAYRLVVARKTFQNGFRRRAVVMAQRIRLSMKVFPEPPVSAGVEHRKDSLKAA
jgi:hypothetical protein